MKLGSFFIIIMGTFLKWRHLHADIQLLVCIEFSQSVPRFSVWFYIIWRWSSEAVGRKPLTPKQRERESEESDRDWRLLLSAGHLLNGTISQPCSLTTRWCSALRRGGWGWGGFKQRPPHVNNRAPDSDIFVKSINAEERRRFLLACITRPSRVAVTFVACSPAVRLLRLWLQRIFTPSAFSTSIPRPWEDGKAFGLSFTEENYLWITLLLPFHLLSPPVPFHGPSEEHQNYLAGQCRDGSYRGDKAVLLLWF